MSETFDNPAEMWAILSEPPKQFAELADWIRIINSNLFKQFKQTSLVWNSIDPDEVIRKFKISCIEYAFGYAKHCQPHPVPDYWEGIVASCKQSVDLLNGYGYVDTITLTDFSAAHDASFYGMHNDRSYPAYSAARASIAGVYARQNNLQSVKNTVVYSVDAAYYSLNSDSSAENARNTLIKLFISIILSEHANKG